MVAGEVGKLIPLSGVDLELKGMILKLAPSIYGSFQIPSLFCSAQQISARIHLSRIRVRVSTSSLCASIDACEQFILCVGH